MIKSRQLKVDHCVSSKELKALSYFTTGEG